MTNKPEPPEEKISLGYIDDEGDHVLFSIDKPAIHNKHGGDMLQFGLTIEDAKELREILDEFLRSHACTELTRQAQEMGMYDEPKMSIEELKKETSQEP